MLLHPRHRVAVLLVPEVVAFDALIVAETFGAAFDEQGHALYEVVLVSVDGAPVAATHGAALTVHGDADLLETADTIVVPGTHSPQVRDQGTLPEPLAIALARLRADQRIVSICSGAFVLAAAGLLDGLKVTTHWASAEKLAQLHPQVEVDAGLLYADHCRVLTSAGLTAGIDLCLHLLRTDHGMAVANRVARYIVAPPWRQGTQAQYIENPVPKPGPGATADARHWAQTHLHEHIDIAALAAHAHMSVRTFNRRFRNETGVTPGAWLRQQRVHYARQLLETTDIPIPVVALRSGLGSSASLRKHMQAISGTSPMAYRRAFAGRPH